MIKIKKNTVLKIGDKIYAPKLNRNYTIVEYNYSAEFEGMLANLAPINQPNENGTTITLEGMADLGYFKV